MLAFAAAIKGLSILARDGAIGEVRDIFFDDRTRDVRWLVVDTGNWLTGRLVLLPASHLSFDLVAWAITIDLTRQQVKESPNVERHRPVSRQMETSIYGYYNWAPYWGAPIHATGYHQPAPIGVVPPSGPSAGHPSRLTPDLRDDDDPHLRSADEVVGYYIHARDGSLGHVEDLLVDPDRWFIEALVVDTKNWWPGKKVVLSSNVLVDISWGERMVDLACTREEIKEAPEYDARLYDPAA